MSEAKTFDSLEDMFNFYQGEPVNEAPTNGVPAIEAAAKEAPVTDSALLKEAGLTFYAEITYISAELHYLDVHSEVDHKLILYSLKDAVQEIPKHLGIQTHRSYWVADAAVKTLRKDGGKYLIETISDESIPVSQSYLRQVRDRYPS